MPMIDRTRTFLPLASQFMCPKVHGMISRYLFATLCCLSAPSILAQIRVELSFDQETYLPQEPLHAEVRIYNSSGQTLVLGKDDDWLSFTVESVTGDIVELKKPVDIVGEFTLPSAHRARKLVNLAEAYDLGKFGRYNVTATVKLKSGDWSETFSARAPRHFGIATGVKLWENTFGLPTEKADGRPEIRKFLLLQSNHLKQLSLYVRLTDESEMHTYSLNVLGTLVGFSRPEPQMDRWSNLHVLYQENAQGFKYHMITPDGMLLARQTWDIDESRPFLKVNSEGRISVAGGVRRISASDLPPPELLSEANTVSAPPIEPLAPENKVDAKKKRTK
jgi:hypothetical protein